jgi:hypothetical protein
MKQIQHPRLIIDGALTICFTICLCISPDLDRYQGTKNETLSPRDPQRVPKPKSTICFTICLCNSPDLDEYQGNKNETLTHSQAITVFSSFRNRDRGNENQSFQSFSDVF